MDAAGRRARRGLGQGGGGDGGGGDGGEMEMGGGGKSDRDDGPDFSGPSRLAQVLEEMARDRQRQNTL